MHFPPSKGVFHGIFRNIVDTKGDSQIKISVSGNHLNRNPYNLINYNEDQDWTSEIDSDGLNWIQFEVLDRFFDITAYALKAPINYPRAWDLHLSLDGCKWTQIFETSENDNLNNSQPHIFSIQKRYGYARFLKMINRDTAVDNVGQNQLYLTKIDIYGWTRSCNNCNFFPPLLESKCNQIHVTYLLFYTIFIW